MSWQNPKARHGMAGYAAAVSLIKHQPGLETSEISKQLDLSTQSGRKLLCGLRSARIIRRVPFSDGCVKYRWYVGEEPDLDSGPRPRPGARMVMFASLLRALEALSSADEVAEEVGSGPDVVRGHLNTLHKAGLIRRGGYARSNAAAYTTLWIYDDKFQDAKKPPRMTAVERNKGYRERRRAKRVISRLLAAPSIVFVADSIKEAA